MTLIKKKYRLRHINHTNTVLVNNKNHISHILYIKRTANIPDTSITNNANGHSSR
jgi:hypothetical protein